MGEVDAGWDRTSVRSEVRAWRAVVTAKVEAEMGRGEVGAI